VYDGVRFHRIDLGGAAGRMEYDPRTDEHVHRPPPDSLSWPEGSESGQEMLSRTIDAVGGSRPNDPQRPAAVPSARPSPPPAASAGARDPSLSGRTAEDDERPRASVALVVGTAATPRGASIQISGTVEAAGEPCAFARVDVSLRSGVGVETWLGAFPTDASGRIDGRVTVPFEIDVGDYKVIARTPGTGRCGGSR
jgi:hypothetical protein